MQTTEGLGTVSTCCEHDVKDWRAVEKTGFPRHPTHFWIQSVCL